MVDACNAETTSKNEKDDNVAYLKYVAGTTARSKLSVHKCDVLDTRTLRQILCEERPNKLIHAAGLVRDRKSVEAANEFYTNNLHGTESVLNAAEQSDTVKHIVYISTRSAIGETATPDTLVNEDFPFRPINPYGVSKAAAELACHSFHVKTNLPVTVLRMWPMYGERCRPDMLPRRALTNIQAGRPIIKYGTGEAARDWLYARDAACGIIAAMERPMAYSVFHLGSGLSTTVNELLDLAEKIVGRQAIIHNAPVPPGDAHFGGLCDRSKAKHLLNWEPRVDLETGLARTFEYMQKRIK